MKAILLAAERGIRRLHPDDSYPRALIDDDRGRRVLDWVVGALRELAVERTVLVGGYHIEKLIANQPALPCYYNPHWATTGAAFSLMVAADELAGEVLVSCTDVVYHASTLHQLMAVAGDVVVGVVAAEAGVADGELSRLAGRPVEFSGLVRLSADGAQRLRRRARELPPEILQSLSLPGLIARAGGGEVALLTEGWARVDTQLSMARFVLGSKSQTLDRLRGQVRRCTILDQVRLTSGEWRADPRAVLDRIRGRFGDARLVVRSSAKGEDSWTLSQAGRYDSVLDIDGSDPAAVADAIGTVIASFGTPDEDGDEIFVQPFLSDIRTSGVIFTRDPESGAPYVVVNFDAGSGRSDTVTGGHGDQLATAYALRGHLDRLPAEVADLRPLVEEVEDLLHHDALDLEFALDGGGRPHLLQVRPITPKKGGVAIDPDDVVAEVEAAARFVEESMRPQPGLLGASTVFANMPDWNPAEIVGTTPRPLAVSLYRHLVMDDVWAGSRAEMGYRSVRAVPLMKVLAGHPYVDVRATFNSFIPASLPEPLAARLADHYIERLRAEPRLQDKVEFEIVFTCLDFCFDEDSRRLADAGFSAADIGALRDGLTGLTGAIVTDAVGVGEGAARRLDELDRRREAVLARPAETVGDICRAIALLTEDCRTLGTLPFANLARQAFVATALLRSLERRGVLGAEERMDLMADLPTVAGELSESLGALAAGTMDRAGFLARFGHLRPGTYDILSPSYGERPDLYIEDLAAGRLGHYRRAEAGAFESRLLRHRAAIDSLCAEHGLGGDAAGLARFCAGAIPGREWGKFVFTRNLSAVIGLVRQLGGLLGFSEDDMSYLPIHPLLHAVSLSPNSGWRRELRRTIDGNRKAFAVGKAIRLPSVITAPGDLLGYTERDAWPNFITAGSVTAPLVVLEGAHAPEALAGRVVAIEKADPGYDWLFARGIAGLVTKYGGVASHMAIRCAEFGLPAAIGCGERIFESIRPAKVLELNCAERRLQVVH